MHYVHATANITIDSTAITNTTVTTTLIAAPIATTIKAYCG